MKPRLLSTEDRDEIRRRFYYKEGKIFHKVSGNKRTVGTEAGVFDQRGYGRVSVNGRKILVHRVVYLLHYDTCPEYLDHKDQDKRNNHIENLRPCTHSENKRNIQYKGCVGVRLTKVGNWESYTSVNGKYKYLGTFPTKESAILFREIYLRHLYGDFHAGTSS